KPRATARRCRCWSAAICRSRMSATARRSRKTSGAPTRARWWARRSAPRAPLAPAPLRSRKKSMQTPWPSPEPRMDQAAGLSTMNRRKPVNVIAVTGGKGGVGKTSVAINLALSMRLAGREVMLLDADLGLANVDVLLGLQPAFNLSHVLEGKCKLADTILEG